MPSGEKGFQKGKSGNPNGRPKGVPNKFTISEFKKAIQKVQSEQRVDFFEHIIKRALLSDNVLIAVLRKLIPDINRDITEGEKELIDKEIGFYEVEKNKELPERLKQYLQN